MRTPWFGLVLGLLGCQHEPSPTPKARPQLTLPSPVPPPLPAEKVVVQTEEVPGDQPLFALRGGKPNGVVGVVLHGHCSHGMGLLQAFQWAASKSGRFIALQGDQHCGSGPMRAWSNDLVGLDRRIDAALRVYLGREPPAQVLLIGSSQGAERIASLARRFPAKYPWLVLMSGPHELSARGLTGLQGAYFFVGEHEARAPMTASWVAFRRAGLAVDLSVIPGAGHADFRGQGDALMGKAMAFLGFQP